MAAPHEIRSARSADDVGQYGVFSGDGAGGNDRLIAVDSLTRVAGTVNLDTQSGYTNVDTGETGLNVGVIDAGVVSGTPVVAIGGDFVRSYDAYNI